MFIPSKKTLTAALSALFIFLSVKGPGQITFQRTLGGADDDWIAEVHQTSDGGYIMAGATWSYGTGGQDIYVVRLNPSGDTLWTRTFGYYGDEDCSSIIQTSDGGFILAGVYDLDFLANTAGAYVIRLNAAGDTLWTRTYGGDSIDYPNAIIQTMDQGFMISGVTNSFGADEDIFLIQIDANGDTLWESFYYTYYNEGAESVIQTLDSGFLVTGYIDDTVNQNAHNVILMKTDLYGDTLGTMVYDGNADETGLSVIQLQDSGYAILGTADGFGGGDKDVYLIRTGQYGNVIWSKAYGGSGDDLGYDIKQTADQGFIIVGKTNSFGAGGDDVYLIRTDSTGDTLWTRAFGGTSNDEGQSVAVTSDGGFVIGANTYSFGAGFEDFYIIKTDANGNAGCHQTSTATNIISASTYEDFETPDYEYGLDPWYDSTTVSNPGSETTGLCFSCAASVPICMVTVDSTSTKNVVIWEKPTTSDIVSFNIYRKVINSYVLIGTVPYDSLSLFTDTTNGINPNTTSYRYKISVLDTCGMESDTSAYHETIHLTTNQGTNGEVNLVWDAYEGFPFTYYRIMRDTTGTGNFVQIDSVPNSNFTYTDWNPPQTQNLSYMIEVVPPSVCVATRAVNYHSSRSNMPPAIDNSIGNQGLPELSAVVYPNPNKGDFILQIKGLKGREAMLSLFNMQGQKVLEKHFSHGLSAALNLQITPARAGMYYLQISNDRQWFTLPFAVYR